MTSNYRSYNQLLERSEKLSPKKIKKKPKKIAVKTSRTIRVKKISIVGIKGRSRKIAKQMKNHIKNCEICGDTKQLQVHHKDKNALNNDINNLQKLCLSCHTDQHTGDKVHRLMKKLLNSTLA